jgi:hypothetical protein
MSVRELSRLIGTHPLVSLLDFDNIRVRVEVLDVRTVFGRTDILVTPVEGAGEAWISADRIYLEEPAHELGPLKTP